MPTDPFLQSARVPSSKSGTTTIGEELTITGNVTATSGLILEGNIQGDCVSLLLGENSQLEGGVVAEEVIIAGRLIGSVQALRVTLKSNSHVEGDIVHQRIAIEEGAYFEGKARHSDDPLSNSSEERVAPKPRLVAGRAESKRKSRRQASSNGASWGGVCDARNPAAAEAGSLSAWMLIPAARGAPPAPIQPAIGSGVSGERRPFLNFV